MMQINNIKLPSKKREREREQPKFRQERHVNIRIKSSFIVQIGTNHIEQLEVLVRQYGHKRYNQVKKSPL